MEDMLELFKKTQEFNQSLRQLSQEMLKKMHDDLRNSAATATVPIQPIALNDLPTPTPQQAKKRAKRLSSLREREESAISQTNFASVRKSTRASNSQLLAAAAAIDEPAANSAKDIALPTPAPRATGKSPPKSLGKSQSVATIPEEQLMPPPSLTLAVPVTQAASAPATLSNEEVSFARPQRAAKLKSEKNLKEPKLNVKLRRPNDLDSTNIKLEHEQRPSQMHLNATAVSRESSKSSTASVRSEDSVVVLPQKASSVVDISSDDEDGEKQKHRSENNSLENDGRTRGLCIKVKREKTSVGTEAQVGCSQTSIAPGHEVTTSASQPVAVVAAVTEQLDVPRPKVAIKAEVPTDESTVASTTLSTTTSVAPTTKRGRKKKDIVPRPIKVEKFSDVGSAAVPSRTRSSERPVETLPVASRTRNRSRSRDQVGTALLLGPQAQQHQQDEIKQEQLQRSAASVYEDAVDQPIAAPAAPVVVSAAAITAELPNATMVIGVAPSDATFCANPAQTTFVVENQNPNATVTLDRKAGVPIGDATFNMPASGGKDDVQNSVVSSHHSMQTAREENDSIITEDESYEQAKSKLPPPTAPSAILPNAGKAFKMPTRTNELFNPLVQSPVKKKVEAFENAVAQQAQLTKSGRPKRTKENTAPSSISTPTVGKLGVPALGRFLTPTQSSNLTPSALAQPTKAHSSASKVMAFPTKSTMLKATTSASSKPLSRENSAEDFRKGLHQLAEERKKQREQKQKLAAQQREAKERERAERMAKLAKEREEKRLKKKQEAEQKKRDLEEIQRKLRQQEEAANECSSAKAKAPKLKTVAEQERQMLAQMKPSGKMQPPPSKMQSKYTFEMLHEDDSTDEETKTTYKRPPPPIWSRSHVRGADILMQQSFPTPIIDSFFSVQPMTPDLRVIFPEIDPRLLKRNSSVLWSTPPRYSELPKY